MTVQTPVKFTADQIKQREWRFAYHLPKGPQGEDLHLIKEQITLKDGRCFPNLRVINNFERPVWVSKLSKRGYTDKKEYEHLDNLDMHMTTQSKLPHKLKQLLKKPWSQEQLSELCASPFVYAADVPSTAILNRELYQKAQPDIIKNAYRNAAFDTETDVVHGTGEIIIGSMTMLPEVHLIARRDFFESYQGDIQEQFKRTMEDKLGPEIERYGLQITLEVVESEIDIVERSFKWFHDRKPDWMSIWNMDFDVTKIMEACERAKVDPKQILCDPSVPYQYRICRYKRGSTQKKAASGKLKPVSPHDQWHTLFLTASFYVIDAMSSYRLLRLGEQEERSYALDAILERVFDDPKERIRKLTHPPADKYVKLAWHKFMQSMWKFVYLAYAAMDTISMCLLDRKTRDLSHKLPSMADITSFDQANSQPKRLRDAFFVFALEEHNSVSGSAGFTRDYGKKDEEEDEYVESGGGSNETDEDDEGGEDEEDEVHETLSRKGWVITLPSHLSAPGLKIIKDIPDMFTGIRAFTYDSDAVSSYPSCTQVGNVAKVTTRKEVSRIGDFSEHVFRMQNLNLLAGATNAIEYTTTMFKAPTLLELEDLFKQRIAQTT